MDTGQNDLRKTRICESAYLFENPLQRHAPAASPSSWNNAVATGEVAPLLNLEKCSGAPQKTSRPQYAYAALLPWIAN